MARFQIHLLKPTKYDDDGYPLQWLKSLIPSNSLACVAGITEDALRRGALEGVDVDVHSADEINTRIDPAAIIRQIRAAGGSGFIALIGVQTNQYPRALDLARAFRAAGLPVCIGGFHVSGVLSMLKELTPELQEAQDLGISFFAGEAEDGRMDEVLRDAHAGTLKPVYNWLKHTPNLAGSPVPILPRAQVDRTMSSYSSFDLGRGCPFECSFCTIINVQGRKSRFRTPDDLEAIVRQNAAIGVNCFFMTDDNFARNKNWEPFCDRLIQLKEQGLPVRMAIQVDTLAHRIPGFIDKAVAAGADQIFIGLENINSDNLEFAKKRQNRVEEYREMFLTWKKHAVFIVCGYIIGFPGDTPKSIAHDIDIIKRELPLDAIYLNYLTPLPGSEDHRRLHEGGVWMDPELSKYDLTHRVTHHPVMSDGEWEAAYDAAHATFYSWDHMETILRRVVALGSNKRLTTVHRLLGYREAVRLEKVSKLEGGFVRIKRRRQRRSDLPRENPLVFYPRYAAHVVKSLGGSMLTYVRLRLILRRIMNDPQRMTYTDDAIKPIETGDQRDLLNDTRSTATADKRRAKAELERAA